MIFTVLLTEFGLNDSNLYILYGRDKLLCEVIAKILAAYYSGGLIVFPVYESAFNFNMSPANYREYSIKPKYIKLFNLINYLPMIKVEEDNESLPIRTIFSDKPDNFARIKNPIIIYNKSDRLISVSESEKIKFNYRFYKID